MSYFFGFESPMERSLAYIPMLVRMKLDTCGVKLSLAQWNLLPEPDRRRLFEQSCDVPSEVVAYREALCALVLRYVGKQPRMIEVDAIQRWQDTSEVPQQVMQRAIAADLVPPTLAQWRALTPAQRFVLIKLTRADHQSANYLPALQEFSLA